MATRYEQLEALERIRQLLQAACQVADGADVREWRDAILVPTIERAERDIEALRRETDPRYR